jgi:hypothetical protein
MIVEKRRRYFTDYEGRRKSITLPHLVIFENSFESGSKFGAGRLRLIHSADFVFEKVGKGKLRVLKDRTGKLL